MSNTEATIVAINRLYHAFALIYKTEADQRRVVDSAGLNSEHIQFGSHAINAWYLVFSEARKQNKVDALIKIAVKEYAENEEVRLCELLWLLSQGQLPTQQLQEAYIASLPNSAIKSDVANTLEEMLDHLWRFRLGSNKLLPVLVFAERLAKYTPQSMIAQKLQYWVDEAPLKLNLEPEPDQLEYLRKARSANEPTASLRLVDFTGVKEQSKSKPNQQNERPIEDKTLEDFLETCEYTLVTLESLQGSKILPVILSWVEMVELIPNSLINNPRTKKIWQQTSAAVLSRFVVYAKNSLTAFQNISSIENKLFIRLHALISRGLPIEQEMQRQFEDLQFVITYLSRLTPYEFVDIELAGVYINLAWHEEANRPAISQQIERLQQNIKADSQIFRELLDGLFSCEKMLRATSAKPHTMLRELADDYVIERFIGAYKSQYPWWQKLILAIDQISTEQSQLYTWSKERQREKAKVEALKLRAQAGLSFVRDWWPLDPPTDASRLKNDANYNFPKAYDERDLQGATAVYAAVVSQPVIPDTNAFDICEKYLSNHQHHILTGQHRSGKTWLRLYLEWYILSTDQMTLPVFYFAPATFAYQSNQWDIVKTMASSIANQIFASLLERSNPWTSNTNQWDVQRMAVTGFLHRYGYDIPTGKKSLAQPIPADTLLDIEQAYGRSYLSSLYAEMQQEIEHISLSPIMPSSSSVESMLDDIQRATEVAGYRNIFLLIDNWDALPHSVLLRLLQSLLSADLLVQLQQRNIFLKVFVPPIDAAALNHLQKKFDIVRLNNGVQNQLSLYVYP